MPVFSVTYPEISVIFTAYGVGFLVLYRPWSRILFHRALQPARAIVAEPLAN